MAERLDPEALADVLGRYFAVARSVVEGHGGTVEKFIGDAVVAMFGVERVREDDALRAVRTGLELREAVDRLNDDLDAAYGVRLRIRTGINTGEVLVNPGQADNLAVGHAVSMAARLEQAAGPDQVVVGEPTFRLLGSGVEATPIDPLAVKGSSVPLRAWRVDGLVAAAAPGWHTAGTYVGREAELEAVTACVRPASSPTRGRRPCSSWRRPASASRGSRPRSARDSSRSRGSWSGAASPTAAPRTARSSTSCARSGRGRGPTGSRRRWARSPTRRRSPGRPGRSSAARAWRPRRGGVGGPAGGDGPGVRGAAPARRRRPPLDGPAPARRRRGARRAADRRADPRARPDASRAARGAARLAGAARERSDRAPPATDHRGHEVADRRSARAGRGRRASGAGPRGGRRGAAVRRAAGRPRRRVAGRGRPVGDASPDGRPHRPHHRRRAHRDRDRRHRRRGVHGHRRGGRRRTSKTALDSLVRREILRRDRGRRLPLRARPPARRRHRRPAAAPARRAARATGGDARGRDGGRPRGRRLPPRVGLARAHVDRAARTRTRGRSACAPPRHWRPPVGARWHARSGIAPSTCSGVPSGWSSASPSVPTSCPT